MPLKRTTLIIKNEDTKDIRFTLALGCCVFRKSFLKYRSLRASSPIWASETSLTRIASLAQIGELNLLLFRLISYSCRAVHSGGAKGAVAPARKTKCFFSNIVSDFAGLFLVAILVRNLTKTEFAPADKKS